MRSIRGAPSGRNRAVRRGCQRPSSWRSASSSVAWRNVKPVARSRAGSTRALASNSSSAIWPRRSRAATAGSGRSAGRPSTRPSVRASSRLVTGSGATAFTGPTRVSVVSAWWIARTRSSSAIQLTHWAPPLTGAAAAAQRHADPEPHDADPGVRGGLGGGLPLAADLGEKARARRALLAEELRAAVAVVADGGGGDEDARRALEPGEGSRQAPRRVHAARADPALLRLGPAAARDALARKVHERVHAGEGRRFERAGFGVPARDGLSRRGRPPRAADETQDAVAGGRERRDERRADEPARTRDGDRRRPRGPCHVAPIMRPGWCASF